MPITIFARSNSEPSIRYVQQLIWLCITNAQYQSLAGVSSLPATGMDLLSPNPKPSSGHTQFWPPRPHLTMYSGSLYPTHIVKVVE